MGMKRVLFILIIVFMMGFINGSLHAVELSGDQIITKVDEFMQSEKGRYKANIIHSRPGKEDRVSLLMVYIKGVSKILIRFLAPAQEKGQGYLKIGDENWYYLPNANKSIRISGKQSLQGSDLSVDDILKIRLSQDYNAKTDGEETIEGKTNYILELSAKSSASTYAKIKYWVRQDDFLPAKAEYYAVSGKLIKTMFFKNIREIGGRIRPTRMEIISEFRKGYRTIFEILEADYDSENPDSIFTKTYLEKGK